jgi:hypothetical protein
MEKNTNTNDSNRKDGTVAVQNDQNNPQAAIDCLGVWTPILFDSNDAVTPVLIVVEIPNTTMHDRLLKALRECSFLNQPAEDKICFQGTQAQFSQVINYARDHDEQPNDWLPVPVQVYILAEPEPEAAEGDQTNEPTEDAD